MKLAVYNSLAASTADRLEEISSALREWDGQNTWRKRIIDTMWRCSLGQEGGNDYEGMRCDVLGAQRDYDHAQHAPPAQLQGRAAGMRLRAKACDVTIFAAHLPPEKGHADSG
eukprot:8375606-Pyramimonas_sp.AAC.1